MSAPSPRPEDLCNIAVHLPEMARRFPDGSAVAFPTPRGYRSWSFKELDRSADRLVGALRGRGVRQGSKALVMVRPGPEFVAVTFALFKLGVSPVLIDPGMGLSGVLRCVRQIEPDLLIGIPLAQLLRRLFRGAFASVRLAFTLGGRFPGAPTLETSPVGAVEPAPIAEVSPEDQAAILFTSGSTGPAKGVVYQHGMFAAQVEHLRDLFDFQPGEVDMPGFPLFALFDTALAMTSVIPRLNPSRPAACDPEALIEALARFRVTTCQGSPAIWARVGRRCLERGVRLPHLKRVITFGAPISVDLVAAWRAILGDGGEIFTPYGATEALPLTCLGGREILEDTSHRSARGAGTCVGRPLPGVEIAILKVTGQPLTGWSEALRAAPGEIGEVAVKGAVVTREYAGLAEATARAKIPTSEGGVWHRMGDTGYFDEEGRLWFCGRVGHRIQTARGTLFPVQAEEMINPAPGVRRAALVGAGPVGQQEPVLVVEPEGDEAPPERRPPRTRRGQEAWARELLERFADHPDFRRIRGVLFHGSFPVDPRHNAKIDREALALWATRRGARAWLPGGGER